MVKVEGKNGISCMVLKDSIGKYGKRMTTFEMEFPRIILAENNTHKMIAKNLQSTRALPISKLVELVKQKPYYPVHWGAKQSGMVASTELSPEKIEIAKSLWNKFIQQVIENANALDELGAHKQWASRILEPYSMTKAVQSGTNWDNLLWLRNDDDAQPEFHELAKCIQECFNISVPELLNAGEWHLPYVATKRLSNYELIYLDSNGEQLTLEEAKQISASCCAQASYRKLDESKIKAIEIYHKLFSGKKPHMSPTEHQGTPIDFDSVESFNPDTWGVGITHVKRNGMLCSGNLDGWIQYRQTLPNNVYEKS